MDSTVRVKLGVDTTALNNGLRTAVAASTTAGKASGANFRSSFGDPFSKDPVTISAVNTSPARRSISSFIDKIKDMFRGIGSPLKNIFAGIFQGIGQQIVSVIQGAISTSLDLVKGLMSQVIEVGSRAEATKLRLTTMQGTEKGLKSYEVMKNYAKTTPFENAEVSETGTMLMNSIPQAKASADELLRVLTMVGDAAAGSGQNIKDIGTIVMQINAKGKTSNEEMLQLAERGIPIYQEMSKMVGVTVAELTDMISKSEVGSDVFMKTLETMTTGTGIYAGMVDAQAKTVQGRLSNIKGAFEAGFEDLFNVLNPAISTVLEQFEASLNVGDTFNELMKELGEAANEFATYLKENPEIIATMVKVGAEFLGNVMVGLINAARDLHNWISQNSHIFETLNYLGNALKVLVDAIGIGYKTWGMLLMGFADIFNQVVGLCTELWDATKGIRSELTEIGGNVFSAITNAVQTVFDKTTSWLNGIKEAVGWLKEAASFVGIGGGNSQTSPTGGSGQHVGNNTGIRAFAPSGRGVGNSSTGFTDARGRQSHHRGETYARDIQLRNSSGSYENVPVILQEDVEIVNKGYQQGGAGNYATVKDSRGVQIQLMHFAKAIDHATGSVVKAGTVFGIQGKTGRSMGNEPGGGYTHLDVRTANRSPQGLMEFLMNNFSDKAMSGQLRRVENSGGGSPPTTTTSPTTAPRSELGTAVVPKKEDTEKAARKAAERAQREARKEAEKAERERERQAEELAKQQLAQAENRTKLTQNNALEAAKIALESANESTKLELQKNYDVLKEQTDLANTLSDLKSKLDDKELTQSDYDKFSGEAKNLSKGRLSNINKEYLTAKDEELKLAQEKFQQEQTRLIQLRVGQAEKALEYDIREAEIKSQLLGETKEGLEAQKEVNRLREAQRYNAEINEISRSQASGDITDEQAAAFKVRAEAILQKNLSLIDMETQKAIADMRAEKQRVLNEMLTERLTKDREYRDMMRNKTYESSMTMAQSNLGLAQARAGNLSGDSQVYAQRENAKAQIGIDLSSQIYQLEEMYRAGTLTASQLEATKSNLIEISQIQLGEINDQFLTLEQTIMQGFVSNLSTALEGLITGTKSLGEALSDVMGSMAQMLAQMAVRQLMGSIFPGVPGMASGGFVNAAAKERGLSGSEPILAMLNRDELVLNRKQVKALQRNIPSLSRGTSPNLSMSAMGNTGGISVNIPINMTGVGEGKTSIDSLRSELESVVTGVLIKHQRNGGLLRR